MYGMVNQAIKDLVITRYGGSKWLEIAADSNLEIQEFLFMEYYPDELTYSLVASASKILKLSPETVLEEFGKHWILYTANEGYGAIMDMFGRNFKMCLQNLNDLHARIGLNMPHLKPPKFVFKEISESHYTLEYESQRKGLCPMVKGLLLGLAIKFNENAMIKLEETDSLKIFHIQIGERQYDTI